MADDQNEGARPDGKPSAAHQLRQEFQAELDRQLLLLSAAAKLPNHRPEVRSGRLWWWVDEDGRVLLKLWFRGRTIKVNGTADTAVLGSLDEAVTVLGGVTRVVTAGRLDTRLAQIAVMMELESGSNSPQSGV